jgi:hypothetical protein
MHKKLPIELREKMYELLLDFTDTFAVPRYDKSHTNSTLTFPSAYLFSPTIMGRMVCDEVQQLFVRQAPLNFRGLLDGISIDALLDTRLPSGSIIRDLVRHVRVFVRYEVPAANATGAPVTATNTAPVRPANNVQESATDMDPDQCRANQESYIKFDSSFDGLRSMAYPSRKVRVDSCILGPRSTAEKGSLDCATYRVSDGNKGRLPSV